MKFIILSFIVIVIGFSFSIISIYASSDGKPYLYSGAFFYIISSLLLLLFSFSIKQQISKYIQLSFNVLNVLFIVSALIFSLLILYTIELKYNNIYASLLFILSMILSGIALLIGSSKSITTIFKNILLIIFVSLLLYISLTHALIQMYNSPDDKIYPLFSAITYFSTSLFLSVFLFYRNSNIHNIVSYVYFGIVIIFIWIGIKLLSFPLYSISTSNINTLSIILFISGIAMVLTTGILNKKIL